MDPVEWMFVGIGALIVVLMLAVKGWSRLCERARDLDDRLWTPDKED